MAKYLEMAFRLDEKVLQAYRDDGYEVAYIRSANHFTVKKEGHTAYFSVQIEVLEPEPETSFKAVFDIRTENPPSEAGGTIPAAVVSAAKFISHRLMLAQTGFFSEETLDQRRWDAMPHRRFDKHPELLAKWVSETEELYDKEHTIHHVEEYDGKSTTPVCEVDGEYLIIVESVNYRRTRLVNNRMEHAALYDLGGVNHKLRAVAYAEWIKLLWGSVRAETPGWKDRRANLRESMKNPEKAATENVMLYGNMVTIASVLISNLTSKELNVMGLCIGLVALSALWLTVRTRLSQHTQDALLYNTIKKNLARADFGFKLREPKMSRFASCICQVYRFQSWIHDHVASVKSKLRTVVRSTPADHPRTL